MNQKPRVIWFTTKSGGQFGVSPMNIKYLLCSKLVTKCGLEIDLDSEKWETHKKELVNGCL